MKPASSSVFLALLLAASASHAQMYKWVGPDGKITYSDTPPPKTATRVEQKNLADSASDTSNLPYELAQAAKNHPVTLYSGDKCDPCDEGRNFLKNRGIPFSEKTVSTNEDLARLKQVANESRLPVLMVGRSKQSGFEAGAWGTALNAAGYPASSKLPKTYRHPAPVAAAPKALAEQTAQKTQADNTEAARADSLPPAAGNAPPGFRF